MGRYVDVCAVACTAGYTAACDVGSDVGSDVDSDVDSALELLFKMQLYIENARKFWDLVHHLKNTIDIRTNITIDIRTNIRTGIRNASAADSANDNA